MIILKKMKMYDRAVIRKIYNQEFPKDERKPFSMLLRLRSKGKADLVSIFDTKLNETVGLAFFLVHDNSVLVDYLAIKNKYQGSGYGTEVLDLIRERYKNKKIFGEVEYPGVLEKNNEQRIRRMNFYLRNGLTESGIIIRYFGCTLELMCFDDAKITYEEYKDFLNGVFAHYGIKAINKNIHLISK